MTTEGLSQQTWFPQLLGHEMDKGEHTFPISQANRKFEAFNALQLHLALLMKGENFVGPPLLPIVLSIFQILQHEGHLWKNNNLKIT